MEPSPAEQIAHSTVRIECDLAGGGLGTGTGFFYSLNRQGESHVPVIVTNKHVVAGASNGRFLLTLRNDDGGPDIGNTKAFQLDNFQDRWVPHPEPDVDLCVMPIAPLLRPSPFRRAISSSPDRSP